MGICPRHSIDAKELASPLNFWCIHPSRRPKLSHIPSVSQPASGANHLAACVAVSTPAAALGQIRALCAAERFVSARQSRGTLLCVSPAFQDFAHGRDNPPACAVALQDAQCMCQMNTAHAQHVRFANAQHCRALEHAPSKARHFEVPAIRHGDRHIGDTTGPHLQRSPLRSAAHSA